MALSEKIRMALCNQLNAEMFSSYLYDAMKNEFRYNGYDGMAAWMGAQAKEEFQHAKKFEKYIESHGSRITLKAIAAPPAPETWKIPLDFFECALNHEKDIAKKINILADLALSESDRPTHIFLEWFITEQVEEEVKILRAINQLKNWGDIEFDKSLILPC